MKEITESDVQNLLAKSIRVAKQNQTELTYTPLHTEFKIYVNSNLKAILYAIDTAVDYYNHLKIKTYEAIRTVLETTGDKESIQAVCKTIRDMEHREYMFIEFEEGTDENSNTLVVKSVYQRIPESTEDFIKKLNLNKTRCGEK